MFELLGRNFGSGQSGFEQLGKVFGHLCAIERLVGALVASGAVELGHITQRALAVGREDFGQRLHVGQVQVTGHADTVPSRRALGWAVFPILERLSGEVVLFQKESAVFFKRSE